MRGSEDGFAPTKDITYKLKAEQGHERVKDEFVANRPDHLQAEV